MHDLSSPQGSDRLTPSLLEESVEQGCAILLEDSAFQFDSMVEAAILGDVVEAPGGTSFWIWGPEDDSFKA